MFVSTSNDETDIRSPIISDVINIFFINNFNKKKCKNKLSMKVIVILMTWDQGLSNLIH